MKRALFKCGAVFLLSCALIGAPIVTAKTTKKAPAKKAAAKAGPKWLTSHREALALAKKTGKPILIDFNAVWCEPCHMMERDVFQKSMFTPEAKRWILLSIDAEKHTELASHYKIDGFPTLMALSHRGRPLTRQDGYGGPGYTMNWIKAAYKKAQKFKK